MKISRRSVFAVLAAFVVLSAASFWFVGWEARSALEPRIKATERRVVSDGGVVAPARPNGSARAKGTEEQPMPDYGYVGEGLVVNDAPIYQWIVFDLARRHPEWHLGSRDAKELQRQYAALCEAKFRLEGRLAMVTRVSALENRVEIPAFQDQQETLFAGLGQYIDQRFGPDPGMSIAQEMKKLFEGTDGASGAYALTLHIRLENQPGYKYKVVREFAFENGTGMGTDYLRADRLGSLAFNPRFLPTGK